MAAAKESRSLEETPTWAVAIVCFVLLLISIVIEHVIHLIAKWLKKRHKRALYEALEKIKSELMLLGFISLLLTIVQGTISDICISKAAGATWHPCSKKQKSESNKDEDKFSGSDENHQRKLLTFQGFGGIDERRVLAAGGYDDKCAAKAYGFHQLHIFIFILAVSHVIYCITTLALGRAKMRKWKAWEVETKTVDYQFSHDPERFRFARDTTFGRRHLSFWSRTPVLLWIVCFFRQFIRSVPKVDYLTLRYGFIIAHLAPQSQMKFDFQKYIKRSLEEDFKVVVGINPISWLFAVLFLMFNTHGSYSYLWLPFIPLIIILLVGTKLQVVITEMGLKIQERGEVVIGTPVVQPGNDHFWFNRPHLLLYLIHFVLFQIMFGVKSCYHEKLEDVIIRISMGIVTQILCSYVTLPLYALVTQMGSSMKHTIFNERVANGLRNWHQKAKKQIKQNRHSGKMVITPLSIRLETPPETPRSMSPLPLLHKHRHRGEEVDSSQTTPRRSSFEGWEINKDFTLEQKQRGAANQTDNNSNHSHNELQLVIEPYEFSFDQRANR
ncbi:Mlo-related protein [Corchorus capsularis]|uniref:MLO-like protein n=1 Tax=Corchorus capsularis TaxID=210143 RepID=A0A1R3HQQ0_COCAP|nr:Mlo-related protein [Corchorus capsularis]